jgi:hypothetical protein
MMRDREMMVIASTEGAVYLAQAIGNQSPPARTAEKLGIEMMESAKDRFHRFRDSDLAKARISSTITGSKRKESSNVTLQYFKPPLMNAGSKPIDFPTKPEGKAVPKVTSLQIVKMTSSTRGKEVYQRPRQGKVVVDRCFAEARTKNVVTKTARIASIPRSHLTSKTVDALRDAQIRFR